MNLSLALLILVSLKFFIKFTLLPLFFFYFCALVILKLDASLIPSCIPGQAFLLSALFEPFKMHINGIKAKQVDNIVALGKNIKNLTNFTPNFSNFVNGHNKNFINLNLLLQQNKPTNHNFKSNFIQIKSLNKENELVM